MASDKPVKWNPPIEKKKTFWDRLFGASPAVVPTSTDEKETVIIDGNKKTTIRETTVTVTREVVIEPLYNAKDAKMLTDVIYNVVKNKAIESGLIQKGKENDEPDPDRPLMPPNTDRKIDV